MPYVADRNLYTDQSKSLLLEEGDSRIYWTLVVKGSTLSDAEAIKYGLITPSSEEPAPEPVVTHERVEFPSESPRVASAARGSARKRAPSKKSKK